MKLKTKGWVSLFIYLLSIWVNSVLLTLSKSSEAVARGWRMFLDFFPPFLYCSHFFSSQALRKDTQAFVLNLCFTHIPFSVCSRSRTIAWQLSTLLIVWQGQWNLLGPVASVVSASQLESHSSPLTPHLIQITPSSAVAATCDTMGLWQPCVALWGMSSNILVLSDQEKSSSPVTFSMKPSHSPPVSSVIIIVYPDSKYRLWHSFYTYHMLYGFFCSFFCHYSLYATKLWVLRAQTMS